jgi:hypothetical protein
LCRRCVGTLDNLGILVTQVTLVALAALVTLVTTSTRSKHYIGIVMTMMASLPLRPVFVG